MNTEFFAAANGEDGFYSLFSDIFSPETHRRLYILKGGPGSGKSTLMKKLGEEAEKRGFAAEYYACSSDTDSLDGVRIPALSVAVLDGTAPHTQDPVYPGAVERIVNLGEGFDHAALAGEREKLSSLVRAKGEAYRAAYRFLGAAGRMMHEREELLCAVFLGKKADAAILRLVSSLKKVQKGRVRERYLSAIGTKGYVTLDTLRKKAGTLYAVTEKHGAEYLLMGRLFDAFSEAGLAMTVCRTPLVRGQIEGIYLEGCDIFFSVMNEEDAMRADKVLNAGRFLLREGLAARRGRIRFAEKCGATLLDGALSSLREAGRLHGELEAIYGRHIDFSVIDEISEKLRREIFTETP